ncbi:MAG: SulP family inorganic anion transporter [Lautropia sp.]|nr:SulP family inorganic anion transporter [Lautropia sp.]
MNRFLPFLRWRSQWRDPQTIRADLMAGLTGAVVVLPQAIAYATLAGMPIQYGLYAAMVPCFVAALFGSSRLMVTGPANAISLTTAFLISPLAEPFSRAYVDLVLVLCLLVGLLQLLLGLIRFGRWIDKVPHSVVVGFTAGVALLIINSQIPVLTGISAPRGASILSTLLALLEQARAIDWISVGLGILTLLVIVAWGPWNRRVPAMLVGVILGSFAAWLLQTMWPAQAVVQMVPPLPSALPAFQVPALTVDSMRALFSATLVMTLLGLTEASAIAKSLALRAGERVDGNQEFIGQGLANIAGSFFSAYPTSGSFNRSGVNIASGARTPLAAASAAIWLVAILTLVKPLAGFLALPVIAGLLLVVAWRLIDFDGIRHIWGSSWRADWGERAILTVTGVATVAISLEWAILLGLLTAYLVSRSRSPDPEESKASDEEA